MLQKNGILVILVVFFIVFASSLRAGEERRRVFRGIYIGMTAEEVRTAIEQDEVFGTLRVVVDGDEFLVYRTRTSIGDYGVRLDLAISNDYLWAVDLFFPSVSWLEIDPVIKEHVDFMYDILSERHGRPVFSRSRFMGMITMWDFKEGYFTIEHTWDDGVIRRDIMLGTYETKLYGMETLNYRVVVRVVDAHMHELSLKGREELRRREREEVLEDF